MHPADLLEQRCQETGSRLCVGLDPHLDLLPPTLKDADPIERCRSFFLALLEALENVVPVVKPQIAFFESLGPPGYSLYFELIRAAHARGFVVIGDVKRGDIGSTARAYAEAHLGPDDGSAADFVTVNPYLGSDGIAPFLEVGRRRGRGVFVLVRTSNPSSAEFQTLRCGDDPLTTHVATQLGQWGASCRGASGLSDAGAVVGATHPDDARRLRDLLPNAPFLVPGFGAQGASAADVAAAFRADGSGAIVNSSRGVLFAWRAAQDPARWLDAAVAAARDSSRAIQEAAPARAGRGQ